MSRKRLDILILWVYLIFSSVYDEAKTEIIADHTQNIVNSGGDSGYSNSPLQENSEIKIEPTKTLETDVKETVVVVGGGAGGAAAAVKLPVEAEAQPGVAQVVKAEPRQSQTDRESSGASSAEDLPQTDTVPEVIQLPVAVVTESPSIPGHGKPEHPPHAETSSSSQPEGGQQQTKPPSPPTTISGEPTVVSPGHDDLAQPPATTDHHIQPNPGTATGSDGHNADQQVVQPKEDLSPPTADTVDAGVGAGVGAGGDAGGQQMEVKPGAGADVGVEGMQGSRDAAQPEAKMDSPVPNLSQVTPSIDPNLIGKGEKPSNLPTGVGGMAVEPEFVTASQPDQKSSVSDTGAPVPADNQQQQQQQQQQQATNPEGEGDFPTFDKWSVQYLAEQEKQKIEKEQEQAQVVKPGTLLSQKKLRQNFAAEGCGAKVVSSNAEAENINFLLNGNPDEYMISPCKAKKWFVVELCEPVQIHKVELGTLELFSSPPKSFRVASSQRFPTKDWTPIGQFEMTPDRSVQSFHTQVGEEFVKFLRVEMLEHHGKEHYCPLTTLRVLGIDMALDDEDDSGDSDGHEADHSDGDDEMNGAISLFNSAKETVVKLVQKVLYKGDKEELPEEADNATKVEEEEKKTDEQETTPCPIKDTDQPTSTTVASDVKINPSVEADEPVKTEQPQEDQQLPVKGTEPVTTETPIITKLEDTEQLPLQTETPVVVKLDPEEGESNPEPPAKVPGGATRLTTTACPNSLLRPFFTLGLVGTSLMSSSFKMAGTMAVGAQATAVPVSEILVDQGDVVQGFAEGVVEEKGNSQDISSENLQQSVPSAEQKQTNNVDKPSGLDSRGSEEQKHPLSQDTLSLDTPVTTPLADVGQTSSDSSVDITDPSVPTLAAAASSVVLDHAQIPGASIQVSGSLDDKLEQQQSQFKEPLLEPSSVADTVSLGGGGGGGIASSVTVTPTLDMGQASVLQQGVQGPAETDVLKVDPSPTTDEGVSADHVVSMTQLPPTATSDMPIQDGKDEVLPSGDESTSTSPQTVNVTEPDPVSTPTTQARPAERVPDLVKVGMPSSKRDASVMKLNNRIVALEQNVSMTKKYLEELSRAFKQQNEEMMKLINKTESKIASLVAKYDERDLVQQTAIAVLDQKVANLTQVINLMQLKMDTMAEELWRGQILLGILQAIAFLWLFTSSATSAFARNPGKGLQTPPASVTCSRSSSLYVSPPDVQQGEPEGGQKRGLTRRNSDGELHKQLSVGEDQSMKKLNSESNILAATLPVGESTKEIFSQNSKKKKKKKQRQSQLPEAAGSTTVSNACPVLSDSAQSTPAQSPSFSSSAGVLFGTGSPSAGPSNVDVTEPPDSAIAKTTATTVTSTPPAAPLLTFGEMKENSPVGDAGLAQAVWRPEMHGCRMCGDLLASRTVQQELPSPWVFRFPSARLSAPGLCQTHNMMAQYGHVQFPHTMGLTAPPVMSLSTAMAGLGQSSSGSTSPCQPFLDLSNSLHQPGQASVFPQLSPLRVSQPSQAAMASPEFKLPAYRRSKIRRVSENSDAEHSSGGLSQSEMSHYQNRRPHPGSSARKSLVVTDSKRHKSDFVNPKPWEEYFLAKNYLSENRFKFPSSPLKDNLSLEAQTSKPEVSASSLATHPPVQETFRAVSESRVKPDSTRSSVERTGFVSSTRFHPNTPSFIPLQQSSLNSSEDDVFSSSSSRSFTPLRTSAQQEQQPVVHHEGSKSSKDKRRNTISSANAQQCEQATPNTVPSTSSTSSGSVKSSGGKKPPQKTHRRQGSYPLDQIDSVKHNASKSGQGHPGHSSASSQPQGQSSRGDRLSSSSGQTGSQQSQGGSKFKKVPSNPVLSGQSRKSAGAKPAVIHGSSCLVTKQKHAMGSPTAIAENTVTVD